MFCNIPFKLFLLIHETLDQVHIILINHLICVSLLISLRSRIARPTNFLIDKFLVLSFMAIEVWVKVHNFDSNHLEIFDVAVIIARSDTKITVWAFFCNFKFLEARLVGWLAHARAIRDC